MSDRIVVMQGGRIEQLGGTEEIYTNPASAFVAGFIGKQNFIDAVVQADGALLAADGAVTAGHPEAFDRHDTRRGSRVRAAVRAEAIGVTASRPTGSAVAGTLAGISFLGDAIQYVVVTDSGLELISRVAPSRAEQLATGDRVWCGWSDDALHVFAAPETDEEAA